MYSIYVPVCTSLHREFIHSDYKTQVLSNGNYQLANFFLIFLVSTECRLPPWAIALIVVSILALVAALIAVTVTIIDGVIVCCSYNVHKYIHERTSELCYQIHFFLEAHYIVERMLQQSWHHACLTKHCP